MLRLTRTFQKALFHRPKILKRRFLGQNFWCVPFSTSTPPKPEPTASKDEQGAAEKDKTEEGKTEDKKKEDKKKEDEEVQSRRTGNTKTPILSKTYRQLLEEQCEVYEHKDCFKQIHENILWTYQEMQRHSDALANGLIECGGKRGASFTITLPLRVEAIVSQIATAKSQKHWLCSFPAIIDKPLELREGLKRCRLGVMVFAPRVGNTIQLERIYETLPHLHSRAFDDRFKHPDLPYYVMVLHTAKRHLDGMAAMKNIHIYDSIKRPLAKIKDNQDPKKTCSMVFIEYKHMVELSELGIINTGYFVGLQIGLTSQDIICVNLPLHNGVGQALGMGMTLAFKAQMVIPSELFDAEATLFAISRDRCSVLQGFLSHFRALLAASSLLHHDLSCLKKAIIAVIPGEDMPTPEEITEIKSKLNLQSLVVTWGVQKSTGVILMENNYTVYGQFSIVMDHTEIRIATPRGTDMAIGDKGCLQIKGFNADNSLTKVDRWQYVGFLATQKEDGTITIGEELKMLEPLPPDRRTEP